MRRPFTLSSFSVSHFLPRLRPRILHIRPRCSPGSNGVGRVAFSKSSRVLVNWGPPKEKEAQTGKNYEAETSDYESPFLPNSSNQTSHNVADFYRAQPVVDRRIHVIGTNSVGRFVAHSLRGIPNPPPVTLIFHTWAMLNKWRDSAQKLQLITDGVAETREGYDAELAILHRRLHGKDVQTRDVGEESADADLKRDRVALQEGESTEPISSLIVCTKTQFVLQALSSVKHRLHKDSVILFLQSGMGTVEEVNREIFPDPETRPHYMVGVNTHALNSIQDDLFTSILSNFGTLSVNLLPQERDQDSGPYSPTPKFSPVGHTPQEPTSSPRSNTADPSTPTNTRPETFSWTTNERYLLRTLLRSPPLCATPFSPPDLLQLQLEKLAIASIINPLSVLLDARNGAILYNYALTRTIRLLLAETSLVIRSLPELSYIPNIAQRFDPGRLETSVVNAAHRSRDNISSMLADVRAGQKTEIEYLNGWVVKKGEELGIRCLTNYLMVQLVKGKGNMVQMEMGEGVPFVEARGGEGGVSVREGGVAMKRQGEQEWEDE